MTDKMPDKVNVKRSDDYWAHYICRAGAGGKDETTYISEQKHAEEIAALKAEHRAEMAGLCDEIDRTKKALQSTIEPTLNAQTYNNAYCNALESVKDLIKQRISGERI